MNKSIKEIDFIWLCDFWEDKHPGVFLTEDGKRSIRKFFYYYQLDYDFLINAMISANITVKNSVEGEFRYFCGICWRTIMPEKYYYKATTEGNKNG